MTSLAFGFGSPADLAIIFVIALVVFGPKKLPELGRQLGMAMREMRKVTDEITGAAHSVQNEVESLYQPVQFAPPLAEKTGSATVEHAAAHQPFDQEPVALMAPVVEEKVEDRPASALPKVVQAHESTEKGS